MGHIRIYQFSEEAQRITNASVESKPWLHIAITKDNDYYVYVWDTREVQATGNCKELGNFIGTTVNDNHKPLTCGGQTLLTMSVKVSIRRWFKDALHTVAYFKSAGYHFIDGKLVTVSGHYDNANDCLQHLSHKAEPIEAPANAAELVQQISDFLAMDSEQQERLLYAEVIKQAKQIKAYIDSEWHNMSEGAKATFNEHVLKYNIDDAEAKLFVHAWSVYQYYMFG